MFKWVLILSVVSAIANANDVLITDSFSLNLNQRLKSNAVKSDSFKTDKLKYENYFTWILKKLLNQKLQSTKPQKDEWATLVVKSKSIKSLTHLSLMSSSLDDFHQLSKKVSIQENIHSTTVYTPLLDLCYVLENFNGSIDGYVESKFQKLLLPIQSKIGHVHLIHSNNVLSWLSKRDAEKKSPGCTSKNLDEMMMKFAFCPKLALLMQQEIPKEMLTTIANQMRKLKEQTEIYVKDNKSKVSLFKESDFLDLSAKHYNNDCIHLNAEGHQRLADKFNSIW